MCEALISLSSVILSCHSELDLAAWSFWLSWSVPFANLSSPFSCKIKLYTLCGSHERDRKNGKLLTKGKGTNKAAKVFCSPLYCHQDTYMQNARLERHEVGGEHRPAGRKQRGRSLTFPFSYHFIFSEPVCK